MTTIDQTRSIDMRICAGMIAQEAVALVETIALAGTGEAAFQVYGLEAQKRIAAIRAEIATLELALPVA